MDDLERGGFVRGAELARHLVLFEETGDRRHAGFDQRGHALVKGTRRAGAADEATLAGKGRVRDRDQSIAARHSKSVSCVLGSGSTTGGRRPSSSAKARKRSQISRTFAW